MFSGKERREQVRDRSWGWVWETNTGSLKGVINCAVLIAFKHL